MSPIFIALVIWWSVVDGDTIDVHARVWPGHVVEERVRLDVIDTPEMKGPPCERILAHLAYDATKRHLANAKTIELRATKRDAFGRVLGRIVIDGRDLGDQLLAAGHARKYSREKVPWC